jgi:hypothetical protein
MKKEQFDKINELLEIAMYFYIYYPNNFRYTVDEYFKDYIKIIEDLERSVE